MRSFLVAALVLALAAPAVVPVASAEADTPCDPMLLDWLCTVYQRVMETVEDVQVACSPRICPDPASPLLP